MNTADVIAELEAQRDLLDKAIAALKGRGAATRRGRRRLSAVARRRISAGMKRAWAKRKKAA